MKKNKKDCNAIIPWYCNKNDTYQDYWYKRKSEEANKKYQSGPDSSDNGHELEDIDKTIITGLSKGETIRDKAVFT